MTKLIVLRQTSWAMIAPALWLAACNAAPDDPVAAAEDALDRGAHREALILVSQHLQSSPSDAEARILAGEIAMRSGNTDRAISEFKQLLALPGQESEARGRLAEAFLTAGNTRMARETMGDDGLDSARAYSVAIGLAVADGQPDLGRQLLDDALRQFPGAVELLSLAAYFALNDQPLSEAKKAVARAMQADETFVPTRILAGRMALMENEPAKARSHFARALEQEPNNQAAILSMIAIARDAGDDEEATHWLNRAEQAGVTNPLAVYFAARMAYEAGDIDRAFQLIQSLRAEARSLPALIRLEGLVAARRGQRNTAIVRLQRYLDRGGDDALARFVLAKALADNGESRSAWQALAPSLQRTHVDRRALLLGAVLAEELGEPGASALAERSRAQRIPAQLAAGLAEASQAIRASDWEKADRIYARLLAAGHDDHVGLLNNAANAKLETGQGREAERLARAALAHAPDDPVVLDTLGWVLFRLHGPTEEARTLLARAADMEPANRTIADHLEVLRKASSRS